VLAVLPLLRLELALMALALDGVLILLLGICLWHDVATRLIPDWASVTIALLGLLERAWLGPVPLLTSAASALLLLTLLLIPFARGMLGGGDVKLLVALALGVSPLGTYTLVVATAAAGGVLAVGYLLAGRLVSAVGPSVSHSTLRRVCAIEAWRLKRRGPLPYGVAIAAGAVFILWQGY
jgi:prepilin peptidase CpaA